MVGFLKRVVDGIKGIFRFKTFEERAEEAFVKGELEPVKPKTDEEEAQDLRRRFEAGFEINYERLNEIAEARERVQRRYPPTSLLDSTGRSVPTQTHGRPLDSFTGPGMRKLRSRGRKTRLHEKRLGIDHGLTMKDVEEPQKRRRRRS